MPRKILAAGTSLPALSDNGTVVTSTEPIVIPDSNTTAELVTSGNTAQGIAIKSAGSGPQIYFTASAARRTLGIDTSANNVLLAASAGLGWNSSATDPGGTALDTILTRDAAVGTLALKQSATTDALLRVYGANAGYWEHYSATELLTLSIAGTTTDTTANLLPANSIIHAVCCRITTTITTATNWSVGDPTTAARFSAANATLTSGTTSVGLDHMSGAVTTLAAGPSQAAAAKVRITTTGTPGAGIIRIQVFASRFVPPTS